MYLVVGRLYNRNKATGFRCIYKDELSKSKEVNLSNESIDKLIKAGVNIDISKNKRGYYFKDRKRSISQLQRYNIAGVVKERNKLTDINSTKNLINKMGQQTEGSTKNVFTGHELESYISGLSYDKEITKINHLKEFLEDRELYTGNCFIVTGMKRTGKTIVVEQAIRYLLNKGVDSTNIVLIQYKSVVDSVKDEIDQLIRFMDSTSCEYIFVDEVTLLNGFVDKSKGITDYTCKLGKKVVLSGSDTLAFVMAEEKYINNRCFKICTTVLEYKDWFRIRKQELSNNGDIRSKRNTIIEYMKDCTLNKYSYYKNNELMYEYLMEAISENVTNSINKNTLYKNEKEKSLTDITKEKILFMFYIVCYDVVHKAINANILSKKDIRINKGIGEVTKSIQDKDIIKSKKESINNNILERLGLSKDALLRKPKIKDTEYKSMLNIMKKMDIIDICTEYRSLDADIKGGTEYILKVPSIYSRFIENIFNVCSTAYGKLINKNDKEEAYGLLFEAVIVIQIKEYLMEYAIQHVDKLGKLRIDNNKEIDILIPSDSMDNVTGCLYDVKFSSNLHDRHFKTFDNNIRETYSEQIESGHAGIIYTGETVKLRGGLVAINAHDFLMDIGRYIGIGGSI